MEVPESGVEVKKDLLSPSRATAELTVANTSTKIKEISAAMSASSVRSSWRDWISGDGDRAAEMSERLETGVSPWMEVVAELMALVSPVSSVPTDERAAAVSAAEELLDRVASVASKAGGQHMKSSEAWQRGCGCVLMAPVYVCTVVKRPLRIVSAEDS
jgi:hypothetical protein